MSNTVPTVARIETPLKLLLEREGRSQAWLARTVGSRRQSVWAWCNGIHAPDAKKQKEIAKALGRGVDEVFPG